MDQVIAGTASRKSDPTRIHRPSFRVPPGLVPFSRRCLSRAIIRSRLSYDGHLTETPFLHPFCRVALPHLAPAPRLSFSRAHEQAHSTVPPPPPPPPPTTPVPLSWAPGQPRRLRTKQRRDDCDRPTSVAPAAPCPVFTASRRLAALPDSTHEQREQLLASARTCGTGWRGGGRRIMWWCLL